MPAPTADTPDAHRLLAIELRKQGKFDAALRHIARALDLKPDYPAGYYNLAVIKLDQGHPDQAEKAWRKAIELKADYHQAYAALGTALRRQGRHDEAIAASRKAIELKPDNADAHLSLATALYVARQFTEAGREFEQTLRLEPKNVLALNNYGNLLADTDRPAQAAKYYRRAVKLNPTHIEILGNLANVLKAQAHVDDALECIERALKQKPDLWHVHSNLLLTLNCTHRADQGLLAQHREWAKRHADPLAPREPKYPNERSPDRKLRIGYVSSDFRRHSVAYFIEPVLRNHDRSQVQIFGYCNVEFTDDVTARIEGLADIWRPIFGMNDQRVAQLVRDDQIDILVDLNGHTANHRLLTFARKPAPVQVSYLGYPNTTGLLTMDYRITDPQADPIGMTEPHHTERLARLVGGAWCYQPPENAPDVRTGRRVDGDPVVFGCFNNFAKVSQQTFEMWVKILHAVPRSVLLIKAECMSDPAMQQSVRSEFLAQDIDPGRIDLVGREPSFLKHLEMYRRVDIALDTFPYHGTTTTCEAMWMGVPVVTLAGHAHVSRVGASLLHRVGLDELVAHDREQYVTIAAELAKDYTRRRKISGKAMRARMKDSPLMDAKSFVAQIEEAYRQMWKQWLEG